MSGISSLSMLHALPASPSASGYASGYDPTGCRGRLLSA